MGLARNFAFAFLLGDDGAKIFCKKTVFIYSVFCAAFVCLITLSYTMLGESPQYYAGAFTSTIIMSFFVFLYTSADSTCKKVFLFISYANVFCMFVCISLLLTSIFFKGASELTVYYARNIIRTILFIPMVFIYIRFLRPTVRTVSGKQRKTWYSISVVSVLFLAIFALFLVIFHSEYAHIGRYIPFFAIFVLLYMSILWVIFGTVEAMIDESNAELINQNVAYLQGQLKTAKEHELAAKTVRNDFRHHNRNLVSRLEKGEIEDAVKYLKQYDHSLNESKINEFCPHITVNAILNSFYNKAQKNGIKAFIEADTSESTPVTDMDFVAVLSNLLENAVNGCIECKSNGEIRVNI